MDEQLELERHVALNEIERRQRTIDSLVAALERVQSDGKEYRNVMSGTTLAAVDAALALARGEE